MKLTNEETARVFLMYWRQQFIYRGSIGTKRIVTGLTRGWDVLDDNYVDGSFRADRCKLLLTPLSKIGDEDKAGIAKMYNGEWCKIDDGFVQIITDNMVKKFLVLREELPSYLFQYLISKGCAVPLFFAPNHWANGKTAIELEIAIDKTSL